MPLKSPSVYYLANAGIYLTDHHSGVLIDGLFDSYDGFDALPLTIEAAIFNRQPPFETLTDIIFTHGHIDHYSPSRVSAYLEKYPDTRLFLPDYGEDFGSDNNNGFRTIFPGLFPVTCHHLLDKGTPLPHTALFFTYAGQNFFFSGDSDPVYLNKKISSEFLSPFTTEPNQIHMAFVNPFFLSLTPGRRFLERLHADHIYVYHMPLQVPDTLRYHEILERGMQKYTGKSPVQPLTKFMDSLQ